MTSPTPLDFLYTLVSLLLALSLASERLVEIIKGVVPFLNTENTNPDKERLRRMILHVLAFFSGVLTTYLALPVMPQGIADKLGPAQIVGLGLLASGGSSFWNSILTYLLKVKNLKEAEAVQQQVQAKAMATQANDNVALQNLQLGN